MKYGLVLVAAMFLSACSMGKSASGTGSAATGSTNFNSQSLSSSASKSPADSAAAAPSSGPVQISTFIKTMYDGVLHRPAADSEVQFWQKVLLQGGCVKVGFGIATSLEARALTADSRGARQEVVDLYKGLLGRDPESADVVAQHLSITTDVNQTQMVLGFVNSPEYLDRCAHLVP